jgi:hypothetical protein
LIYIDLYILTIVDIQNRLDDITSILIDILVARNRRPGARSRVEPVKVPGVA